MLKGLILSKFLGPIIRHAATTAGGALVAYGIADEATAAQIVGGLTAAGGIALSLVEKQLRL